MRVLAFMSIVIWILVVSWAAVTCADEKKDGEATIFNLR
jgi:hypothetical protein